MGVNTIGVIVKRIVTGTNIAETNKKLTKHSGRKTLLKKLDDAWVPQDKIIAVTWHRHEKSLDDYVYSMNHRQSRELSNIISGMPAAANLKQANSFSACSSQKESTSKVQWFSNYPTINLSGIGDNTTVTINVNNPANTVTTSRRLKDRNRPVFIQILKPKVQENPWNRKRQPRKLVD